MSDRTVLWLAVGDRSVASTRVRAIEPSEELQRRGWQSRVIVGSGVRGRLAVVGALLRPRRTPVVVLQKLFYGRAMRALVRSRSSVLILECDDAVHLGYPEALPKAVETDRERLTATLAQVDLVTTSTPVLARDFVPRTGRVVTYAGPAPPVRPPAPSTREQLVVWLGSPSTTKHLEVVGDLPRQLTDRGWACVAIGARPAAAEAGWTVVPWSEASASDWLARAAVGLMPQSSAPWDDRKAAYKILEYAAAGVVPVASDVLPAQLLFDGQELDELLVAPGGDWVAAVERVWERRADWLPRIERLAAAHSLETAVDRWLQGVEECRIER